MKDDIELTREEDEFCRQFVLCFENMTEAVNKTWINEDGTPKYKYSYSRKVGADLYKKEHIQERIKSWKKELMAKLGLSAYGCVAKLIQLRDVAEARKETRTALACQAEIDRIVLGKNDSGGIKSIASNPDGTVKVEFTDDNL